MYGEEKEKIKIKMNVFDVINIEGRVRIKFGRVVRKIKIVGFWKRLGKIVFMERGND